MFRCHLDSFSASILNLKMASRWHRNVVLFMSCPRWFLIFILIYIFYLEIARFALISWIFILTWSQSTDSEFLSRRNFLSLSNSLYDFFFRPYHEYFLGLIGVYDFFSFNFPLRVYFFCTSPAPLPHKFSNGPSRNTLRQRQI